MRALDGQLNSKLEWPNQYESAYFPAPYADNNCFQQPRSVAQSGVRLLILRASTQQLGLAVGRPTFANSPQIYTRNDLRRSEIQNFLGVDPPLRCIT